MWVWRRLLELQQEAAELLAVGLRVGINCRLTLSTSQAMVVFLAQVAAAKEVLDRG